MGFSAFLAFAQDCRAVGTLAIRFISAFHTTDPCHHHVWRMVHLRMRFKARNAEVSSTARALTVRRPLAPNALHPSAAGAWAAVRQRSPAPNAPPHSSKDTHRWVSGHPLLLLGCISTLSLVE